MRLKKNIDVSILALIFVLTIFMGRERILEHFLFVMLELLNFGLYGCLDSDFVFAFVFKIVVR